jgi:hypothetical protein
MIGACFRVIVRMKKRHFVPIDNLLPWYRSDNLYRMLQAI